MKLLQHRYPLLQNHWMGYGDVVDVRYNFLDLGSDPAIPALHDKFAAGVESYPQKVNPVPSGTPCAGGDWYYDCNSMIEPTPTNFIMDEGEGIYRRVTIDDAEYASPNQGVIHMEVRYDAADNNGEHLAIFESESPLWKDYWVTKGCTGSRSGTSVASINLDTYVKGDIGESLSQLNAIHSARPQGEYNTIAYNTIAYNAGAKIELDEDFASSSINSSEPIWEEATIDPITLDMQVQTGWSSTVEWNSSNASFEELLFSINNAKVSVTGEGNFMGHASLHISFTRDKGTCPVTPTPVPPTFTPVGTLTPIPQATNTPAPIPTNANVMIEIYDIFNRTNDAPVIPNEKRPNNDADTLYIGSNRSYTEPFLFQPDLDLDPPKNKHYTIRYYDKYSFGISMQNNEPYSIPSEAILWQFESDHSGKKEGDLNQLQIDFSSYDKIEIIDNKTFIIPNYIKFFIDQNNNGIIEPAIDHQISFPMYEQPIQRPQLYIKGISNRMYKTAYDQYSYYMSITPLAMLYYSSHAEVVKYAGIDFLQYFRNRTDSSNVDYTKIQNNFQLYESELKLTHNTGENWNGNSSVIIDELLHPNDGIMAKEIARSLEVYDLLKVQIFTSTTTQNLVQNAFQNVVGIQDISIPINQQLNITSHSLIENEIDFLENKEWPLNVAIGTVKVNNLTVISLIARNITSNDFRVIAYHLEGDMYDLFDYDYKSGGPGRYGAMIQIPFNTNLQRNWGVIFQNQYPIDVLVVPQNGVNTIFNY